MIHVIYQEFNTNFLQIMFEIIIRTGNTISGKVYGYVRHTSRKIEKLDGHIHCTAHRKINQDNVITVNSPGRVKG